MNRDAIHLLRFPRIVSHDAWARAMVAGLTVDVAPFTQADRDRVMGIGIPKHLVEVSRSSDTSRLSLALATPALDAEIGSAPRHNP